MTRQEFRDFLRATDRTGWSWQMALHPAVLKEWLKRKEWVTDEAQPCKDCAWKEEMWHGAFSEAICKKNVAQGGTCYRQMLKTVVIPVVEKMLTGEYPSLKQLGDIVYDYQKGKGLVWSGTRRLKLMSALTHELIGMVDTMGAEHILPDLTESVEKDEDYGVDEEDDD